MSGGQEGVAAVRFSRVPLTVPSAPSFPTQGSAGVSVLFLICTTPFYLGGLPAFKKVCVPYMFPSSCLLIMLGSDLPELLNFIHRKLPVCARTCVRVWFVQ